MALDPILLATLTSAVTLLGTEYGKGLASDAGKATWQTIKSMFQWSNDPVPADIPKEAAAQLSASPELAQQLIRLLQENPGSGIAASMVEKIDAEKVIVIHQMQGNIHM